MQDRNIIGVQRTDSDTQRDEIMEYVSALYLGPVESCMHLFGVATYTCQPPILRLPCHMPNHQPLSFSGRAELLYKVSQGPPTTLLTAWFLYNAGIQGYDAEHLPLYLSDDDVEGQAALQLAHQLTYVQFPQFFVYHADKRVRVRSQNMSLLVCYNTTLAHIPKSHVRCANKSAREDVR